MKINGSQLRSIAWVLSSTAALLALVAWWQGYGHNLSSIYQLFPLFGLLAFSIMWSHYIAAALKQYVGAEKESLKTFFEITSNVVLVAILLHPGLLVYQLWQDGAGLPPMSAINYVAPALKFAVILGEVALVAFLAYEFRDKYGKKPWWKFVQYASDVAMLMIFVHALLLGGQLQNGWFRYVWYFYGVTLVGSLLYMYRAKKTKKA
jgi:hypothetical protein